MIDLCTLGTGGSMPMPDRALSSLYVRVNGRLLLVDCGEGTQTGVRRAGWGFVNVDAILITHFHADHCGGLPGFLLSIAKTPRTEPIHLYGPVGLRQVVSGLCVVCPPMPYPMILHELHGGETFSAIGLTITCFSLNHGVPCLGYRFELPRAAAFDPEKARALKVPLPLWRLLQQGEAVDVDGRRVEPSQVTGEPRRGLSFLFATDTRPVPALVEQGRDVDMMILEGMYGDEAKRPQALKNRHMLFEEAAGMARNAGARALTLTHFSPSLEEPEAYLPNAQAVFPDTVCASDGLCMTLRYQGR
ncbi:MAG: ribonuclease Z [Christensenellaceae bacterium]|nr:ribonuclease Z [Christensenellaceae bacterium]